MNLDTDPFDNAVEWVTELPASAVVSYRKHRHRIVPLLSVDDPALLFDRVACCLFTTVTAGLLIATSVLLIIDARQRYDRFNESMLYEPEPELAEPELAAEVMYTPPPPWMFRDVAPPRPFDCRSTSTSNNVSTSAQHEHVTSCALQEYTTHEQEP